MIRRRRAGSKGRFESLLERKEAAAAAALGELLSAQHQVPTPSGPRVATGYILAAAACGPIFFEMCTGCQISSVHLLQ